MLPIASSLHRAWPSRFRCVQRRADNTSEQANTAIKDDKVGDSPE